MAAMERMRLDQDSHGGRIRIIATLTEAASMRRYLEGVGLPPDPPTIAPPTTPASKELKLLLATSDD